MPSDSLAYGALISQNILAARARARLKQSSVAARMVALGFSWHSQTVGEVEKGRRRVTAEEILGLALALESTALNLMCPDPDDGPVHLPSGDELAATSVIRVVLAGAMSPRLRPVSWEDDKPVFAPELKARGYADYLRTRLEEDTL